MTERRSSRRDLLRLLGQSLADFAEEFSASASGGTRPGGAARPPRDPSAPSTEVPVERGRLVVDLAAHPVPVTKGRRFAGAGWPETVLVVRVTPEHFAAVTGDCPHCGGPLWFDVPADRVRCPRRRAAFRMDGQPVEGPRDLELRVYLCRAAGPRLEVELV